MSTGRSFDSPEVGPLYVQRFQRDSDPGFVSEILAREHEIVAINGGVFVDSNLSNDLARQVGPHALWAAFKGDQIDPDNMIGACRIGPSATGSQKTRSIKKLIDPASFFIPVNGPVYNHVSHMSVTPEYQFQGVGEAMVYTGLQKQRQYRPALTYIAAENAKMRNWAERQDLTSIGRPRPIMVDLEQDHNQIEVLAYVSKLDTVDFVMGMALREPWLRKSPQPIDL